MMWSGTQSQQLVKSQDLDSGTFQEYWFACFPQMFLKNWHIFLLLGFLEAIKLENLLDNFPKEVINAGNKSKNIIIKIFKFLFIFLPATKQKLLLQNNIYLATQQYHKTKKREKVL